MECSISQISLSICKMKTACATNNHGQIQRKCHISSEIPCIRWCKRQQGVQFLIVRSIEIGKLGEMQPASFKSQWIFKCAHTNTRPYSHLISAAVAIIRGKHTAHTQTCINIALYSPHHSVFAEIEWQKAKFHVLTFSVWFRCVHILLGLWSSSSHRLMSKASFNCSFLSSFWHKFQRSNTP